MEDEHVVKIYDTITLSDKGQMFIVMEYCEGGNLQQWIKRSRRHKLRNQTVRGSAISVAAMEHYKFVRS